MNTRTFAKSNAVPDVVPGEFGRTLHISLPGTQALLVHQLFNEAINGIRGVQFETQIGLDEIALQRLFDEFSAWVDACDYDSNGVIVIRDPNGVPIGSFERTYTALEIKALRNMAEVVMLDLGQAEFSTRTGFTLAEAKQVLDRFNESLLDPLRLDEAKKSIAH